jgi:hypothetical protein
LGPTKVSQAAADGNLWIHPSKYRKHHVSGPMF